MPNSRFVTTTRNPHIKNTNGLSVIVLCAGIGHRMKSYGPKSLLMLPDGHTIISKIMENVYLHYPKSELIVTVGFEADKVIDALPPTVHVIENQLYEETNTLEETRLALNAATNENVLLIHGDLIFNAIALDKINKKQSCVIIDSNDQIDDSEIGVTVVDNKVTIFAYDLPKKWCYVAYLTGEELELFRKIVKDRDRSRWYVFEALNEVVLKGGQIKAIEPKHMEISRIEKSKDWKTLR